MSEHSEKMHLTFIGTRMPRIDAPSRATGEAQFTADLMLPREGSILLSVAENGDGKSRNQNSKHACRFRHPWKKLPHRNHLLTETSEPPKFVILVYDNNSYYGLRRRLSTLPQESELT